MQTKPEDALWLDAQQSVSLAVLAELSGLPEAELHELVEYGALVPANALPGQWTFSVDCLVTVRKATRLRRELELDTDALALALTLLEQIKGLEADLRALRAQLPRSAR